MLSMEVRLDFLLLQLPLIVYANFLRLCCTGMDMFGGGGGGGGDY